MRFSKTAVLAAIMLAGCGSGGDGQANSSAPGGTIAAEPIDPCSLVTADEVAEAIGEKVVATKPGEGSCTYETADAQASTVTIEVNETDAAGQMDIARRSAGALRDIGGEASEGGAAGQDLNSMLGGTAPIPKVGDEAFFGPNSELNVRKSFRYLKVAPPLMRSRMSGGNPTLSEEEKQQMAMKIANRALSRL